jgi:ABC-2 type transport system permease protein
MVPIWVMFRKDLKLVYRNPSAFVLLLVMPFVVITIVSGAFKPVFEGARSFEVPVVDLDHSPQSEHLLAELDDLEAIDLKPRQWDKAEFRESDAADLFSGQVRDFVVLVIPRGFGYGLATSGRAIITVYADPVQVGFSNIVLDQIRDRLAIDELLGSFVRVLAVETGSSEAEARQTLGEEVEPRLTSPGLKVEAEFVSERKVLPSHFEQTVPGFSVMFTFWLSIYVAASIYAEKKQYRTWHRTLVAPLPRLAIIGSRVLAYVVLGLAQLSVLFLLGWALFGMNLGDDPLALWIVLMAVALVTTGFGIFMASLIQDFMTLTSVTNVAVIALAALGGALIPVFFLPYWMQKLSPITPHYWAMDAIQRLIILGGGLPDVLTQIGVLLAFAAFFYTLGFLRFRFTD